MRWFVVLAAATVAACSYFGSDGDDQAVPPDAFVPPDACAEPALPSGCVAGAFDALMPDGEWQMTGSATTTVCGSGGCAGSAAMTTMTALDGPVTITRNGCTGTFTGFTFNGLTPSSDPRILVNTTGMSFTCEHSTGCARGEDRWSLCVEGDGQLHFSYTGYRTSTMPAAPQTLYSTTAVLAR